MELRKGEVLEDLDGDRKIIQNANLYRFTSDSILLSRFVTAHANETVADFCAGCGIVGFNFLCLNAGVRTLTLVEMQPDLADMARRTAEYDGFDCCEVVCSRVQDLPRGYEARFSLILCNPPYGPRWEKAPAERGEAICRSEEELTLDEAVAAAARCLRFGGRLAMVHRASRTAALFSSLKAHGLEPKRARFVSGKEGAEPYLVMVEAKKGAHEGLRVLPTLVNG